jgi:hypothetical protein
MNLTEYEQKLLLRALDKATVDVEAEKSRRSFDYFFTPSRD